MNEKLVEKDTILEEYTNYYRVLVENEEGFHQIIENYSMKDLIRRAKIPLRASEKP